MDMTIIFATLAIEALLVAVAYTKAKIDISLSKMRGDL
jgi:hypothetical protein